MTGVWSRQELLGGAWPGSPAHTQLGRAAALVHSDVLPLQSSAAISRLTPFLRVLGKCFLSSPLSDGCGAEVAVRGAALSQDKRIKYLLCISTVSAKLLLKTWELIPTKGEIRPPDPAEKFSEVSDSSVPHRPDHPLHPKCEAAAFAVP